MAQLISLRIWADRKKNPYVGFHPTCHLEIHEQSSYKELHNLKSILIGDKDQLIHLSDLKKMETTPSVVLIELPQREIGGQLPSWEDLNTQIEFLKSKNIIVHLDGARLWECLSFYNKTYAQIAGLFDSVYLSFYKGIGATSGAVLLGNKDFIKESRVWLRRHGGNLVTLFPLYLSAKMNLEKRINNFPAYFKKTQDIVKLLQNYSEVEVTPNAPHINMFHLFFKGEFNQLMKRSLEVSNDIGIWTFGLSPTPQKNKFKFEWYVGDVALELSIEKIKYIFDSMLKN